jgi:hypothetical protein
MRSPYVGLVRLILTGLLALVNWAGFSAFFILGFILDCGPTAQIY